MSPEDHAELLVRLASGEIEQAEVLEVIQGMYEDLLKLTQQVVKLSDHLLRQERTINKLRRRMHESDPRPL